MKIQGINEGNPFVYLKPSKAQLKFWAGLDLAKNRRKEGRLLAEGIKVVREALRSRWETEYFLVRRDKEALWKNLLPDMAGKTIYELTEAEWKKISQDKESEGIATLMAMPHVRFCAEISPKNEPRLLLLYQVGNPLNLGAILRSAHWFGVKTILLSEGSVDFTHPKVIRTSMGSLFHLEIIDHVDFSASLPEIRKGYALIGTIVQGGVPLHPMGDEPSAILLGSESHGLPEELLSLTAERWSIPRLGDAESLSLPQAAAVLLYEWTKA
ncbi:MAG: RNA methyltransferase [Syntrophales bacterium]|jgi:TrmH family RNA methyltransferase|nr:RNA methyltransferase [Syntrophales bacterium]